MKSTPNAGEPVTSTVSARNPAWGTYRLRSLSTRSTAASVPLSLRPAARIWRYRPLGSTRFALRAAGAWDECRRLNGGGVDLPVPAQGGGQWPLRSNRRGREGAARPAGVNRDLIRRQRAWPERLLQKRQPLGRLRCLGHAAVVAAGQVQLRQAD